MIIDHDFEVVGQKITAFDFEVFRYLQGGVCNIISDMYWGYSNL